MRGWRAEKTLRGSEAEHACARVSEEWECVCQVSAEPRPLVTRQGWTLSRGGGRRWSDYISDIYDKREEKSTSSYPLAQKASAFTEIYQTELMTAVTMQRFISHLGGVWRDEAIGTGALEFCLAVVKGGE